MSEREIRSLLGEICHELDRRARSAIKNVAIPAALGAGLALGACSDDSTSPPKDAATADIQRQDGQPRKDASRPSDGGVDLSQIDMGPAPEYAAPQLDAGIAPAYMAPDFRRVDAGPTPDYAAPTDLGVGPLYMVPDL
jgi:hypothetical protein